MLLFYVGFTRGSHEPLDKHYKLGAHIEASRSRSEGTQRDGGTGCTAYNPTEMDSDTAGHPADDDTCTGWVPVGNNTTAFTGSLQGAGYEIRNLYISIKTTTTRGSLFGQTGSASVIQNVGVTNAYIQVDTASSYVGGLVGRNAGSLSNSYASGSVSGSGNTSYVGGLVGYNTESLSNSYTSASVSGETSAFIGGLVGYNTGSISNSYASSGSGLLSGGSNSNVGGLVGRNDGSLSNSYATGMVSASASTVGGLVGWMNLGSLSNSYATGMVSASTSNVGGLVGQNVVGISGKNYYVASDGAIGRGIGSGNTCAAANCIRATGANDAARRTWLQDTLDESTAAPAGMGWSDTNWARASFTSGYPKLLYAQVGYCSASPTTLTTEAACTAAGSCSDTSKTTEAACVAPATWTSDNNTWDAGADECGGSTGVVCGARIPGQ